MRRRINHREHKEGTKCAEKKRDKRRKQETRDKKQGTRECKKGIRELELGTRNSEQETVFSCIRFQFSIFN